MIAAENLSKQYGGNTVISSLSFVIPDGAKVMIPGESGSGKTTLLRLIAGLEKPDGGRLYGYDTREISYMFQEPRLLPWEKVLSNVIAPVGRKKETKARELLSLFELDRDLDKYPDDLSGGMKQRVALARALLYDKKILILDEPFSSLDDRMRNICAEAVKNASSGKTVILVSHRAEDGYLTLGDHTLLKLKDT